MIVQPLESTDHPTVVPFKLIRPSGLNPRKRFDEPGIAELAASIRARGLLQNLVVRPHKAEHGVYEIVAGERRYRALQLLLDTGELPEDYPVPVKVEELSDRDLLLTATTENVQRQNMTPLEEAEAFAQLMKLGSDEESIALTTGVTPATVRMRLKLATDLCADARRSLDAGRLTLAQAHALLLASKGLQKELLPRVLEMDYDPKTIRRLITQDKIPIGRNIFPLERYTEAKGTFTRDIFQPEHPGWFDDRELFIRLQNEAVEEKIAEGREQGLEVEVVRHFSSWDYTEGAGMVVVLNDFDYSVEFREGFVKKPRPQPTLPQKPSAPEQKENRRRNEWETTTVTRAVHEEAAKDFRLCVILNAMALMGVRGFTVKIEDGKLSNRDPNNRIFSSTFQEQFDQDRQRLSEGFDGEAYKLRVNQHSGTSPAYAPRLHAQEEGVAHVFNALKEMSDDELYALFSRLTATTIAHGSSDIPWSTEIKRLVAQEADLEIARYFDASAEDYLTLHTKAELGEMAKDAGVMLDVTAMKKAAAVTYLSQCEKIKVFVPKRVLLPEHC